MTYFIFIKQLEIAGNVPFEKRFSQKKILLRRFEWDYLKKLGYGGKETWPMN